MRPSELVSLGLPCLLASLALCGEVQAKEAVETDAQKAPTTAAAPAEEAPSDSKALLPFDGRSFSLGVTAGYYAPTEDIFGLKVNPFGAGFGISVAYTLNSGVWFGLQGQYFLGSTISQIYKPSLSTLEIAVDAKTQANLFDLQVGYDLRIGPVVVRYGLDIGLTFYSWDMGEQPYLSLAGFYPMQGSSSALHVAPGMGVLVPLGAAFVGIETRYRIETNGQVPSAFGGHLHAGWRL